MSADLSQALLVISVIAVSFTVLSPILCWVLPNRTRSA